MEEKNSSTSSSRSRSTSKNKDNITTKEKAFIKSELIWKTSSFENSKKKDKFLRLLGTKAAIQTEDIIDNNTISSTTKVKNDKINQDLEKQFALSLKRKDKGRSGLGF